VVPFTTHRSPVVGRQVNPQIMIHLTEKPVELAARAIEYSSKRGDPDDEKGRLFAPLKSNLAKPPTGAQMRHVSHLAEAATVGPRRRTARPAGTNGRSAGPMDQPGVSPAWRQNRTAQMRAGETLFAKVLSVL
jgi:hypothetical protein